MPLHWTIDSRTRLFTATAEGTVSLDEVMAMLEAAAGARALGYRKLFDGRTATSAMAPDELLLLCARLREYHAQGPMGALALVATSDQTVTFSRLLGALASADRPIRIFATPRQARAWLDGLAPSAG
jgi:hypothetical protein